MSKKVFIPLVLGAVLVGGFLIFFSSGSPASPREETPGTSAETDGAVSVNPGFLPPLVDALPGASVPPAVSPSIGASTRVEPPSETVVVYLDDGFSPARPVIHPGDRVTFLNQSSRNLWVASDPHPAHTDLLGFDSLTALKRGQTYSFVFTMQGEWKFHNHASPGDGGTVVVEE